jgi:hypothetical protein
MSASTDNDGEDAAATSAAATINQCLYLYGVWSLWELHKVLPREPYKNESYCPNAL